MGNRYKAWKHVLHARRYPGLARWVNRVMDEHPPIRHIMRRWQRSATQKPTWAFCRKDDIAYARRGKEAWERIMREAERLHRQDVLAAFKESNNE